MIDLLGGPVDCDWPLEPALELGDESREVTAGRPDGVARKQSGKVDHVEPVIQVFAIHLQPRRHTIVLPQVHAGRSVE